MESVRSVSFESLQAPIDVLLSSDTESIIHDEREIIYFLLNIAKYDVDPYKDAAGRYVGWSNVFKHNISEAKWIQGVGEALGLPPQEIERCMRYSLTHNPEHHKNKFMLKVGEGMNIEGLPATEIFTRTERKKYGRKYHQLMEGLDEKGRYRKATSPKLFDEAFKKGKSLSNGKDLSSEELIQLFVDTAPLTQLLVYYTDAIHDDEKIMHSTERIKKMRGRRGDLDKDKKRAKRYKGMKYWDAEFCMSSKIEIKICEMLKARKIEPPEDPKELPFFIHELVMKKMAA